MTDSTPCITPADLCRMFHLSAADAPEAFHSFAATIQTAVRPPAAAEMEAYILDMLKRTDSIPGPRSPAENLAAFEKGWQENLDAVLTDGISPATLKPRYFRGSPFLRYQRSLVVSDNLNLEYELFVLARLLIFSRWLQGVENVWEFGCGSCANLMLLSDYRPDCNLVGLDWASASVGIATTLAQAGTCRIRGEHFDFLQPRTDLELPPDTAVLTVHALEQLDDRHQAWVEFLLRQKPALVVNYEPILDFYDQTHLLDYLAFRYCRKRGYLRGYLETLRNLERAGRIEILEAFRPELGGVLHEASLIVWRPL